MVLDGGPAHPRGRYRGQPRGPAAGALGVGLGGSHLGCHIPQGVLVERRSVCCVANAGTPIHADAFSQAHVS